MLAKSWNKGKLRLLLLQLVLTSRAISADLGTEECWRNNAGERETNFWLFILAVTLLSNGLSTYTNIQFSFEGHFVSTSLSVFCLLVKLSYTNPKGFILAKEAVQNIRGLCLVSSLMCDLNPRL